MGTTCLDVIMAKKYPTDKPTDPLFNQQTKHHRGAVLLRS